MFCFLHWEDLQLVQLGQGQPLTFQASWEEPLWRIHTADPDPGLGGGRQEIPCDIGASVRRGVGQIWAQLDISFICIPACQVRNGAQEKGAGKTVAPETPAQRVTPRGHIPGQWVSQVSR